MKQINLDKGYRVSVCDKIGRVHGYGPESNFPVISIYRDVIQASQSLPENLTQAAYLVKLYGRCIEEYRLMMAEELYSRETLE